jgi:polyisoprenoid-binding protein YceI
LQASVRALPDGAHLACHSEGKETKDEVVIASRCSSRTDSAGRHDPTSLARIFHVLQAERLESDLPTNRQELLMTKEVLEEVAVSTWSIDPAHSAAHFRTRYMAIVWVRGEFRVSRGKLTWDENNMEELRVEVEIDCSSVYTGVPKRDQHLRSADFLDVERFPSMRFQSTHISRLSDDTALVAGDLTIRGVCRRVELRVTEISAATRDAQGNVLLAGSATARVNRKEFGITWNKALDTGGFLVGDEILIDLDVEFVRAAS